MDCYIDGISHAGEGVARINGKATFIPFTIPGETVTIKLTEEKKNYQRAHLENIITPSPDRIDPPCRHYFICGGCSYQHVNYERQMVLKRQVVEETIKRIGGIDVKVNPVIGMEDPWHYRNKVEWHTGIKSGEPVLGYYINNSHTLIDIEDCLLISQNMKDCSRYIKRYLQKLQLPAGCEIIVRQSVSGDLMFIFNGTGTSEIDYSQMVRDYEEASIYSFDQGVPMLHNGKPRLLEKLGELAFEISPLTFFQVNHMQTERMLEIIKDYAQLRRSDAVLDAYCGTGSIALSIARDVNKIVGVESFKAAVKDAKRNAFNNQITNCRFIKGNCEDIIPEMEEDFNVVILDPPRSGCKKELIQAVIKKSPRSIIYVSCNPSTLARDLALFINTSYIVEQVQPIDMFPQTHHIECCVLLCRK
ncbi:MAG: methyltransferase, TrmA family [Firmicutes bacterium]|nr:methyltransferase, TrmA family [Bacillota bacterium]